MIVVIEKTVNFRRGMFVAAIRSNERICDEHYRLRMALPEFPPSRPGQFIQLQCRPVSEQPGARELFWPAGQWLRLSQSELADREPMLRRPISIAGRRDLHPGHGGGPVELEIIYRTIGAGTRWLAGAKEGQELSVMGPLGNGFAIRPRKPQAVLVGGGVGIPPMLYLAGELARAGKKVYAFSGVRSVNLLPLKLICCGTVSREGRPAACVEEFARCGAGAAVATDDGSLGYEGFVSNAFRDWVLETKPWMDDLAVYSCGPEAMMKAVADVCLAEGIDCQLAMERHMACGVGTCQSCVVKIRDSGQRGWSFKLCCSDGPVFDARDVLW